MLHIYVCVYMCTHVLIYKTVSEICSLKEEESTMNFGGVQVSGSGTVYLTSIYKRRSPLTVQNCIH